MFNTPNNFVTHQPEYLGVVSKDDFKQVSDQSEADVPIQIEKLVKKDGEDHLITLDRFQINEAIENGDKAIESRYEALLKTRHKAYNELLEALAAKADKNTIPTSYSHKIAAVEDARGDVSKVLNGYVNP